MLHPILIPLLAIDLYALHEVATVFVVESLGRDMKCVVTVDSDFDVVKPWRYD
jgi:hypothetical protein